MERMPPDSLLPFNKPGAEAPDIEQPAGVAQEQAIGPDAARDTLMLDLGKVTLEQLVNLDILGPSLGRIEENVDSDAVAGFSQGLA